MRTTASSVAAAAAGESAPAFEHLAFGLRWRSSVALPFAALREPAGKPDVAVRLGKVPARLPGAVQGTPHLWEAAPGVALLQVADVARYLITPKEVVIEPCGGGDEDIAAFLANPVAAALLQQRGLVTLHAAAVEMDAGAVLLLGASGAGKSALAAALVERGCALVADNLTGLAPAAGAVLALPAFPRLGLWADALPAAERRQRVRRNLEKYWAPAARFAAAPRPLCAAFVLDSHNRTDFNLEPVPAGQAFWTLWPHTYRKRLLDALGQRPTHYRIGTALARSVPFVRVTRPAHPFRQAALAELADRIEAHVRGACLRGKPPSRSPAEGSCLRGASPSRSPAEGSLPRGEPSPRSPVAASGAAGWPSAPPAARRRAVRKPPERRAPSKPGILWIASYPKSGSTWTRAVLTNYLQDSDEPAFINALVGHWNDSIRDKFDELIGVDSSDLRPDELARYLPRFRELLAEALCAPRPEDGAMDEVRRSAPHFAKTHEIYQGPVGGARFSPAGAAGVIDLVRNPLDVAVSYAHHLQLPIDEVLRLMSDPNDGEASSASHIHSMLPNLMTTWSGHVSSWLEQTALRLQVARYEDLLADPQAGFGAIVQFAGLQWDAGRLARAVERSAFHRLRAQEAESGYGERQPTAPLFFRAGVAGSWRAALTREQVQALVDAHRPVMERLGYLREAEAFLCG